eukprot:COSAG04_NODE_5_length_50521_cov_24.772639_13_plen_217_part_00
MVPMFVSPRLPGTRATGRRGFCESVQILIEEAGAHATWWGAAGRLRESGSRCTRWRSSAGRHVPLLRSRRLRSPLGAPPLPSVAATDRPPAGHSRGGAHTMPLGAQRGDAGGLAGHGRQLRDAERHGLHAALARGRRPRHRLRRRLQRCVTGPGGHRRVGGRPQRAVPHLQVPRRRLQRHLHLRPRAAGGLRHELPGPAPHPLPGRGSHARRLAGA